MLYFTYKNKKSTDFGLMIYESNYLGCSERNIENIEVPGRNGNLLVDYGNFKNYQLTFNCDIKGKNLDEVSMGLKNWLQTDFKYSNLDIYRNEVKVKTFSATYISKLEIDEVANNYGEVILTFECEPVGVVNT